MPRMRSADRRRQLLEVAAELFARKGYRGTTTAELAKAAGITEPILYRHFKNKLDLFVSLMDEVGREVTLAWKTSLSEIDDPHERLQVLLSANPATHERGRGMYRVIFHAMTEGDQSIAKPVRRHLSTLHSFLSKELKTLQKEGAVRRDEPADDLAWLLINVAVGYGMTSPLGVGGKQRGRKGVMERLLADLVAVNSAQPV